MSFTAFLVILPFLTIGLAWLFANSNAAPDDSLHISTSDSPYEQTKKLPTLRKMHFREDGIWCKRAAIKHKGSRLILKVEERV